MSGERTHVTFIVGLVRQEPDRWAQLDSVYRPMLLAFLKGLGLSSPDADNVTSDVYIKVYRTIHTFDRSKCRFRTWLFTIARNAMIDQARRRTSYRNALDGWARNVLRATESDSCVMERQWRRVHREKVLAHALNVVRSEVSPKAWKYFYGRVCLGRPAAEVAVDGDTTNCVFVHSSKVMKKVREVCLELDEDIGRGFEPGAD
jgi:RNA polymerase sigma factor (sigma-70 family)